MANETAEDDIERIDLTKLTVDVGEWAEENFGDVDQIGANIDERRKRRDPGADLGALFCVLGVNEEAGELAHAVLKRAQGIREDEEGVGQEAEMNAVGDIIVYLADFCYRRGYDLEECVRRAWHDEGSHHEWESKTGSQDTGNGREGGQNDA